MNRLLIATMTYAAAAAAFAEGWSERAVAEIKKEKMVVDAIFSAPQSLWVSVTDDGSNRDGLAQYLCLVVNDQERPPNSIITISIWDAAAMARQQMKKLGQTSCEKS